MPDWMKEQTVAYLFINQVEHSTMNRTYQHKATNGMDLLHNFSTNLYADAKRHLLFPFIE
jgi:hypothetical protein